MTTLYRAKALHKARRKQLLNNIMESVFIMLALVALMALTIAWLAMQ